MCFCYFYVRIDNLSDNKNGSQKHLKDKIDLSQLNVIYFLINVTLISL
jgi:hypothetical protein